MSPVINGIAALVPSKIGAGHIAGNICTVVGNPSDLSMVRMQADDRLPADQRRFSPMHNDLQFSPYVGSMPFSPAMCNYASSPRSSYSPSSPRYNPTSPGYSPRPSSSSRPASTGPPRPRRLRHQGPRRPPQPTSPAPQASPAASPRYRNDLQTPTPTVSPSPARSAAAFSGPNSSKAALETFLFTSESVNEGPKGLPSPLFNEFRSSLSLRSSTATTAGGC